MSHRTLPRTIENPLVKDRVTFLTTAAESEGAYEYVKVELAPGGGNGLHYHRTYSERFEAVEGELHLEVDGLLRSLRPGESATAPPGTKHRFFNPGPDPIVFHTKIEPARCFEPMLRIAYGLARDGRVRPKSGIPRNALEMAVLFELGESYMNGVPIWLQKAVFGSLYAVARRRGVEERLLRTYCR
ncbi:cupin domain-containing protein [Paenibacillus antri]|uniref:Cupin domain-containing protein n=1 Tax=Paenibacillus antri TaxID=2582848 RepID=A0A5R9G5T5_9BACL|nr:cupin domain-containing protein [Paenibacillus antri]TLS51737.1 cupin domain-containing protein [Paenibacillus antri]